MGAEKHNVKYIGWPSLGITQFPVEKSGYAVVADKEGDDGKSGSKTIALTSGTHLSADVGAEPIWQWEARRRRGP